MIVAKSNGVMLAANINIPTAHKRSAPTKRTRETR